MSNKTSAGPASKPIGVFVLEDQEIVRRGIRVLLEAEPDIEVTGEASTATSREMVYEMATSRPMSI